MKKKFEIFEESEMQNSFNKAIEMFRLFGTN